MIDEKALAQEFHDGISALVAELMREAAGAGANVPGDVIVRAAMMGAASHTAALWLSSSRQSGIPLAQTRQVMHAAVDRFYADMAIREATAGSV